ncbi:hypothetical protein [Thalassotalea euphylliae]|nr:hypothetical protein [Thalassotalea euphylliae]
MFIEFLKNRTDAEAVLIFFVLGVLILFSGVKIGQLIGMLIKSFS